MNTVAPSGSRFADRVALVTGSSRGIGLAIAQRIVAEGGRVCLTGRREEDLLAAVELLGADVAMAVAGSADDPVHQDHALSRVHDRFGRLDVLVNNTGVNSLYGRLDAGDQESMRRILDVNLIATLAWVTRATESGLGGSGGAVVNVASVAGQRPARNIGFYGASKAALLHLTAQLASELAPRVRVNAVAPAVVRTRFAGPLYEGREADLAASYPMSRLGEPSDVASAVAFLASDDASWITGQVVTVDGGLSLLGGV